MRTEAHRALPTARAHTHMGREERFSSPVFFFCFSQFFFLVCVCVYVVWLPLGLFCVRLMGTARAAVKFVGLIGLRDDLMLNQALARGGSLTLPKCRTGMQQSSCRSLVLLVRFGPFGSSIFLFGSSPPKHAAARLPLPASTPPRMAVKIGYKVRVGLGRRVILRLSHSISKYYGAP